MTPEEVSKMISPLLTKMADMQKQVDALQSIVSTSFSKVCDNAANGKLAYEDELKNIKADMLALTRQLDAIRDSMVTGKGINRQPVTLTKDDFAKVRNARIAAASLGEIIELTEGKQ